MPSNTAAWLMGEKVHPLKVDSAPYTPPQENQLVIRNRAVGLNIADVAVQSWAFFPIKYPFVMGEDMAGEVVEVGHAIKDFKVGDRVMSMSTAFSEDPFTSGDTKAAKGAFQEYTVVDEVFTSKIPDSMTFEKAASLPLHVTTAAAGLFQKDALALQLPSVSPVSSGKAVLVWGGAAGVGAAAIQLAKASGYEVLTTASKKNFDFCEKLGASEVFDYSEANVLEQIIAALKKRDVAGVFEGSGATGMSLSCCQIAAKVNGNKLVVGAGATPRGDEMPSGVSYQWCESGRIATSGVAAHVYGEFLPAAMAGGQFVAPLEAVIVGHGLEFIQEAVDRLQKGLSAQKLIVTL